MPISVPIACKAILTALVLTITCPTASLSWTHGGGPNQAQVIVDAGTCQGAPSSTISCVTTTPIPAGATIGVAVIENGNVSTAPTVGDGTADSYSADTHCQMGASYNGDVTLLHANSSAGLAAGSTVTITNPGSTYNGAEVFFLVGSTGVTDGASCNSYLSGSVSTSGSVGGTAGDAFIGIAGTNLGPTLSEPAGFIAPPNSFGSFITGGGRGIGGNLIEANAVAHAYAPGLSGAVTGTGLASAVVAFKTSGAGSGCAGIPLAACFAGYKTQTLNSTVFNTSTVDMSLTTNAGFTWYAYAWNKTPGTGQVTLNTSNMVVGESSSGDSTNGFQATLSSATKIAGSPFYRGTAYGGGGYFEATVSFTAVSDPSNTDFPAPFWTNALEGVTQQNSYQWSGQTTGPPPYGHYFEGDVMEYFQNRFGGGLDAFSQTSHDWWGQNNANNDADQHVVTALQASYASQHRYGMRWIKATASLKGSVCYFYDDVQEGCTTYSKFTNDGVQTPPPTGQAWEYGVIDTGHLILISGCPNAHKCTIYSVKVWQTDASGNVTN